MRSIYLGSVVTGVLLLSPASALAGSVTLTNSGTVVFCPDQDTDVVVGTLDGDIVVALGFGGGGGGGGAGASGWGGSATDDGAGGGGGSGAPVRIYLFTAHKGDKMHVHAGAAGHGGAGAPNREPAGQDGLPGTRGEFSFVDLPVFDKLEFPGGAPGQSGGGSFKPLGGAGGEAIDRDGAGGNGGSDNQDGFPGQAAPPWVSSPVPGGATIHQDQSFNGGAGGSGGSAFCSGGQGGRGSTNPGISPGTLKASPGSDGLSGGGGGGGGAYGEGFPISAGMNGGNGGPGEVIFFYGDKANPFLPARLDTTGRVLLNYGAINAARALIDQCVCKAGPHA